MLNYSSKSIYIVLEKTGKKSFLDFGFYNILKYKVVYYNLFIICNYNIKLPLVKKKLTSAQDIMCCLYGPCMNILIVLGKLLSLFSYV